MRMKYVLKPLALSALAMGMLFVGTPAVHAARMEMPRGIAEGRPDGRHYDRKDGQNRKTGR
ncbi:MAG: hypothetical protein QM665_01950 [Desulfovibrio sp.]